MARKSSTILQEELYPASAERPRADPVRHDSLREESRCDEIDDARLIDLDVDEESPFLRAQKRVSARRSSLPRKTAHWLLWGSVAAVAVCAAGLAVAGIYLYGEHSWRFRLESGDNIEVSGTQNVTRAQIMEVMGANIGRNIFFIPLGQQKAQLEQIPWVGSASVMRFVPNRLKVEIHERTPVAFAHVGTHMQLIDAGGTLMYLPRKRKYSFPVILGMNSGEPLSVRAVRMKVYGEMMRELDSGGAHYSQDLSEVDVSDLEDVKARVNDPAGDVLLHLGSADFLERYKIYVTHAQGWRQQFQKLESVDLRYENQIVVNPQTQPSASPAALSPAAAKAAAAAGVKSPALMTRMAPNERAIPKPAFELTEKKLHPEAKPAAKKPAKKASVQGKRVGESVIAKKASPPAQREGRPLESRDPSRASKAGSGTAQPQTATAKPAKPAAATAPPKPTGVQKPSPAIGKAQSLEGPGR